MDRASADPVPIADPAVKKGQQCPECGAMAFSVIASRMIDGKRCRRKQCRSCQYRASEIDGEPIPDRRRVSNTRRGFRRFGAQQIAEMVALKGTMSLRAIAQQFGCSGETVRQIFAGMLYRDLLPENYRPAPGPNDPSCERCREWRGSDAATPCSLGFPDPIEEGPGFARDCNLYVVEG
jgi:hypothetical protein